MAGKTPKGKKPSAVPPMIPGMGGPPMMPMPKKGGGKMPPAKKKK